MTTANLLSLVVSVACRMNMVEVADPRASWAVGGRGEGRLLLRRDELVKVVLSRFCCFQDVTASSNSSNRISSRQRLRTSQGGANRCPNGVWILGTRSISNLEIRKKPVENIRSVASRHTFDLKHAPETSS
jgi:hypothetical protein